MPETSYLWDNPGTGDSPAGGYGNDELCQGIFRMLFNGTGDQGVLRGWLNDLEVTDGGGLDADVDTGAALCYGVWYESDAAETVALPNNSTVHVVVRASWATQTARLAQVAALTQTPGATYDIPLAEVTTVGGAITVITDERDYCEYSTALWPFTVEADNILADAVTPIKLINQGRYFPRGAGCIAPDATNPVVWTANTTRIPYHDAWGFVDAAMTAGWVTFRVPPDFTGAGLDIYLFDGNIVLTDSTGAVRWGYSAWIAAAGGVLANTAAEATQPGPIGQVGVGSTIYLAFWNLCTLAVSAGDLVHLQIYRDTADLADTFASTVRLFQIEARYTADG
ncbi:MAG: hypothetical protein EHM35_00120 [Planctomycetaceae bacterium]|nr:MAG: hypothetical protein EHM35_00120 [Planctomycetaceae bacterium]